MRHTDSPPIHRRKTHRKIPSSSSSSPEPPDDRLSPAPSLSAPENDSENDENLTESISESEFNSSQHTYTSPYTNIAPLPTFTGSPSECPVAHLARFDRVCRANNATSLDTIVRIFPVTLDGAAALWYDLQIKPNEDIIPWPEIRAGFLDAFTRPDFADRARTELISIKIKDFETVNSYHLRMQWILKKWPEHGFPDTLLKGIFVDGLGEDYQDYILPRRPETLAEALRMALSWERARSVKEGRRGSEGKCGFCGGEHEERGCEVRERMRELWMRSRDGAVATTTAGFSGSKSMSLVRREESMRRGGQNCCQCWKHQCWKRSASVVVADENAVNVTTTTTE